MENNQPINWEQGLFLQPQHFQLTDLYQQNLAVNLARLQKPYLWGMHHIEIDAALLANSIFSISAGTLLMPDGALINIPGNTIFLSRSFGKELTENTQLQVYIGIKALQMNIANVTLIDDLQIKDIDTRYVCLNKATMVNDLYTSGNQASIKNLQYVMRVFWDTEIANVQNYTLLPIAKLCKKQNNVALVDDFIPPCLSVQSCNNLNFLLSDFCEILTNRVKQLERYKHNWNSYDGDRNVQENLQLLQTIGRYLKQLQLILSADGQHPFRCYEILSCFVAELSVFTAEINLFGENKQGTLLMPDYLHDNLTATFSGAISLLKNMLDFVVLGSQNIALAEKQGRYFVSSPTTNFFNDNNNFYLLLKANNAEELENLPKTVSSQAKLCSFSEIDNSVEYSLPGIKITLMSSIPTGIPNINYCLYYQIDQTSAEWLKAAKEQKLALYLGNGADKLSVSFAANGE